MRCTVCNQKIYAGEDLCESCLGIVRDVYRPKLEVNLTVIPYTEAGGRVEPKKGLD